MSKSLYETLGVSEQASADEIKKAYRRANTINLVIKCLVDKTFKILREVKVPMSILMKSYDKCLEEVAVALVRVHRVALAVLIEGEST